MFTGIIETTGTIVVTRGTKRGRFITIKADPKIVRKMPEGGSVSVDGVCLTMLGSRRIYPADHKERTLKRAATRHGGYLIFELMASTLKRTTLGARKVGDRVNVEPAMLAGQPIGGHFIAGHVDGVGRVRKVANRWHTRYIVVNVPRDLHHYLVPQGSIVVNGVSLTIVDVTTGSFSAALTKYTLAHTNLGDLQMGAKVNIEVDLLAKYIIHFLNQYGTTISHHRRGV